MGYPTAFIIRQSRRVQKKSVLSKENEKEKDTGVKNCTPRNCGSVGFIGGGSRNFLQRHFLETKWFIEKSQTTDVKLTINANKKGEVFDGFGAFACWWSQLAGESEYAEEIAKLLFSKEGLGLNIYRYNIGAGSANNPDRA